ncbi:MAG: S41 family peptidase [Pseudomonadota bacterium]
MLSLLLLASLPSALCANERATLEETAARIEHAYVIEAEAQRIAGELRALSANADHAGECMAREEFARALTRTLRDVSGDGHFYIEVEKRSEGDDWITSWRASGFKRGQGITRVEILDGNIGYIRIRSFYELEAAYPHLRGAFDMVASTDALILDLRSNGGGSSQTTWPVQWTFLEPGSPSPMTMQSRLEGTKPREEPPVLWERYGTERPLAILIDHNTFSAPEAVAFTLQLAGRATIVGERSGGGAHMLDDGDDLTTGFTLYTPTSRPLSVATGSNWEGVGVGPDIAAEPEEAIGRAAEALRKQLARLTAPVE